MRRHEIQKWGVSRVSLKHHHHLKCHNGETIAAPHLWIWWLRIFVKSWATTLHTSLRDYFLYFLKSLIYCYNASCIDHAGWCWIQSGMRSRRQHLTTSTSESLQEWESQRTFNRHSANQRGSQEPPGKWRANQFVCPSPQHVGRCCATKHKEVFPFATILAKKALANIYLPDQASQWRPPQACMPVDTTYCWETVIINLPSTDGI